MSPPSLPLLFTSNLDILDILGILGQLQALATREPCLHLNLWQHPSAQSLAIPSPKASRRFRSWMTQPAVKTPLRKRTRRELLAAHSRSLCGSPTPFPVPAWWRRGLAESITGCTCRISARALRTAGDTTISIPTMFSGLGSKPHSGHSGLQKTCGMARNWRWEVHPGTPLLIRVWPVSPARFHHFVDWSPTPDRTTGARQVESKRPGFAITSKA